jgi:ribulose-phosphate 3-epimerase
MCVRSWELREHIEAFEESQVASIHFDVMDGHFVDNIMLGTSYYEDIKALTDIPVDIHLMCNEPERYLDYFNPRENDWVSFHAGARCNHPYRLLQRIRECGARAGIVLDPGTPVAYIEEVAGILDFVLIMAVNPGFSGQKIVPNNFEKLGRVYKMLESLNVNIDIFVDGNTTVENAGKMYKSGANGFIVGTTSKLLGGGAEQFKSKYRKYINAIENVFCEC